MTITVHKGQKAMKYNWPKIVSDYFELLKLPRGDSLLFNSSSIHRGHKIKFSELLSRMISMVTQFNNQASSGFLKISFSRLFIYWRNKYPSAGVAAKKSTKQVQGKKIIVNVLQDIKNDNYYSCKSFASFIMTQYLWKVLW